MWAPRKGHQAGEKRQVVKLAGGSPSGGEAGLSVYRLRVAAGTSCAQAARSAVAHLKMCGWAWTNESDQADRAISTRKLHTLLRFHIVPINVVVYNGSQGRTRFKVGFPLRCFQRLSRPYVATLQCGWRHNRSTRGVSIPVLSY